MPRSVRRKKREEPNWHRIAVTGASVRVTRRTRGLDGKWHLGECYTSIDIEGTLDEPLRRMSTASLLIICEENTNLGSAIGGRLNWRSVVYLPREQFGDLMALILADKLRSVELLLPKLHHGKGPILSMHFGTAPVEAEPDEA
jgi:hypothetical protein